MWIAKASRTEGSRFARFASKWFDFYPAVNIEHRTGRFESLFGRHWLTVVVQNEQTHLFH